MDIYQYIEIRTKGKKDLKGNQIKIPIIAELACLELKINEATLYKNLKNIAKFEGVKKETYKVTRFKEGRKVTFNQDYWWIELKKR